MLFMIQDEMIKPCQLKNSKNWFSEGIPSSSVLDENVKKLEFYKQYREISDIYWSCLKFPVFRASKFPFVSHYEDLEGIKQALFVQKI